MFHNRKTTGPDPFYPDDPDKQKRLNEAVRRGFIHKQKLLNDETLYQLTTSGMMRWQMERMAR